MEERNIPAEQENKKKPYKKPQIITEEMFARPAGCSKCETPSGMASAGDCSFFGDPSTS